MEQTQGSFSKEGPDRYINDFFVADVISSPKYRLDEKEAERQMRIRLNSRGSPIRRTFLGNLEQYNSGKQIKDQKEKELSSKLVSNSGSMLSVPQGLP